MKTRVPILTLSAAVVGLVVGAIMGVVSSSLYLILVSPAIAACVTGLAAGKISKSLRVHGLSSVTIIGIIAALITFGSLLSTTFQMQLAAEITDISSRQGYSDVEVEKRVSIWTEKAAGSEQAAFVKIRIKSGARLTGGVFLDLGTTGNSVIVVLELLLCLLITVGLLRRQGAQPFCTNCDRWFSRRIIGSAPLGSQSAIAAALKDNQFHRLGRRLKDPKLKNPVLLHGRFCDTCNSSEVYLELELGGGGQRPHRLRELTITHADLDDILESRSMADG